MGDVVAKEILRADALEYVCVEAIRPGERPRRACRALHGVPASACTRPRCGSLCTVPGFGGPVRRAPYHTYQVPEFAEDANRFAPRSSDMRIRPPQVQVWTVDDEADHAPSSRVGRRRLDQQQAGCRPCAVRDEFLATKALVSNLGGLCDLCGSPLFVTLQDVLDARARVYSAMRPSSCCAIRCSRSGLAARRGKARESQSDRRLQIRVE